jgi:predicted nucleic acid-binding protein
MNRLKTLLTGEHQILLSTYVVDELKDVVARKFPAMTADVEWFFQSFPFTLSYTPDTINEAEYPGIRDITDLPVLVSAILEDADVLITGDNDFGDINVENPEILKPHEFLEMYG